MSFTRWGEGVVGSTANESDVPFSWFSGRLPLPVKYSSSRALLTKPHINNCFTPRPINNKPAIVSSQRTGSRCSKRAR